MSTWVLQQVSSATELNNYKTKINAALALEGVKGLSVRFPWNKADTDFSILDAGKAIAQAAGKDLSIRFMAGRHTPASVLSSIPTYSLSSGEKVPNPVPPGEGFNAGFEQAWDAYITRLKTWCAGNGVHLLHLSWYGQDWAELNNGAQVRALPGYTEERWLQAHERLIALAAPHSDVSISVELPLSGYGPLSGGQSARLADKIISVVGQNSTRFYAQANGWGPQGEWGAPSADVEAQFDQIWTKPIKRGLQMIQPSDYDWTAVYKHAYEAKASYTEVYLPSFGLAHKDLLASEIKKFAASLPPPLKIVVPGDICSPQGSIGISKDGVPMTCKPTIIYTWQPT